MVKKNDIVTVEIVDITHEGSGVGRLADGMTVFVPNSAVGDLLSVRLVKVNKAQCFGAIAEILSPSPDRVDTDCAVSRRCGGCVFRHVSYAAELRYKQQFVQSNLRRIGKCELQLEPIEPSPAQEGYRNKAQYPVRMQKNGLCAGFFAPRSHEVVDCHACKLQPESFQAVLETVLDFARAEQLPIYNESAHTGLLRHVYLRRGQRTGELMVCLVVNGRSIPAAQKLVEALLAAEPSIVSILLNENTGKTNVILGTKNHLLYGKASISDVLCDVRFSISPLSFYQVNSAAAERLYGIAAEYAALSGTETLLDLYCGAGTIGLSLARRCKEVIGVEIIPQAIENAAANAAQNGITNARFFCADAAAAALRLAKEGVCPDVIILDPPRRGCEQSVLEAVSRMNPGRIVMISCNSATLARDLTVLAALGYTARRGRPADLFPRTAHVECVVLLTKQDAAEK